MAVSQNIWKQVTETYRKIRNTIRYLLSNIYDYDHQRDRTLYAEMREIDRWALTRLQALIKKVTASFEAYEFHMAYHGLHHFCTVEMSAVYLDIIKDRLYTERAESKARRSAQTALYEILTALTAMLAPILTFTCEEVWTHVPKAGKALSIQLEDWPDGREEWEDEALGSRWDVLLAVRDAAQKSLESARQAKLIGHSLDAQVVLLDVSGKGTWLDALLPYQADLAGILITSAASVAEGKPGDGAPSALEGLEIQVRKAPGEKCVRCWIYSETPDERGLCPRCAGVLEA
jgi:isoleucyl-tRNA synthetase